MQELQLEPKPLAAQEKKEAAEAAAPARKKKAKIIITVGKRKKAIARAVVREGRGVIRINGVPLDLVQPRYRQMRIKEPLIIAKDSWRSLDISVSVKGGGMWGQADAARTAIANGLVAWSKDEKLKRMYVDYDRSLLVSDPRRTEPHKPSRSKDGPRATKQQSKR
ncbi:MAG: 30S ribosomal protein S9 [Candidatus Aenigmarchaeota archaeon]|nr:30S ribosomal protein S9 [Candidatus Aenigmarchaeota archaeon]